MAFAEATEVYAESLEDPDLANVYWGKALGLWQAIAILAAGEVQVRPGPRALLPCHSPGRQPTRSGPARKVNR